MGIKEEKKKKGRAPVRSEIESQLKI